MNDQALLAQMPVDRGVCFTDEKGEPSDKVKARQNKLLLKLWPVLSKYLKKDERILYAVLANDEPYISGLSSSYVLAFTTIQIIRVPIKPTAGVLVFTVERIYREPFEIEGGDGAVLHRIPYADVKNFDVQSWIDGRINLLHKDGRNEGYNIEDWNDHYKIGSFLKRYIACDVPNGKKAAHTKTEPRREEK